MMKHTVNISKPYPAILHITVACWATVMFILSPSCSNKDENLAKSISKEDTIATMETLGVTTYISDSGLIRYKIVAEKWDVFDKKNPPYWAFERGIYLEKFDTLFHIDANIKADTAYYFNRNYGAMYTSRIYKAINSIRNCYSGMKKNKRSILINTSV